MKLFCNNIQFREMLQKSWKLTLVNVDGSLLRRCEVQTWDGSELIWIFQYFGPSQNPFSGRVGFGKFPGLYKRL